MSKVVKGVGRAIGSVVKGAVKVLVPLASKTGRKILKVAAIAAAVYFGGAALMGAFGSGAAGAAGLSGFAGAGEGISAAWTSLSTAGTQLAAGNIGNAFSALGSGIGGSAATIGADGSMLVNGAAQGAAAAATPTTSPLGVRTGAGSPTGASAFTGQTATGLPTVPGDAANVAGNQGSGGLINNARNFWNGLDKTEKFLTAQVGTGLVQTGMNMYGAQKTVDEQRQLEANASNRYNTNIGTRLWPNRG